MRDAWSFPITFLTKMMPGKYTRRATTALTSRKCRRPTWCWTRISSSISTLPSQQVRRGPTELGSSDDWGHGDTEMRGRGDTGTRGHGDAGTPSLSGHPWSANAFAFLAAWRLCASPVSLGEEMDGTRGTNERS